MCYDVVRTIENKCKRCYNCVRYCPAKAIKVEKGQAVVLPEKCIGCGNCVKVCMQSAKEIHSGMDHVKEMLKSGRTMIACVAPSFPAEIDDDSTPGQLVSAYRKMGFHKVVEVAFGADLVAREYKKLYEKGGKPYITTACPTVIYYVQKYHPQLIPYLTPTVSPMVAMGLAMKKEYGEDAGVVFIGPCIAKKKEARDQAVRGAVDEVITFVESRILREEMGIEIQDMEPSSFDPPHPSWGRAFPITGGALKCADIHDDFLDYDNLTVEGREHFIDFIDMFQMGQIDTRITEILFCEGCINGPMISEGDGAFARKKKVADYIRETKRAFSVEEWQYQMKKYEDLDLTRSFQPEYVEMKEPSPEEINEVLKSTNKTSIKDELNCKACGYESCRAFAKAVCEGIAEKEMCLTYTIEELEKTLNRLHKSHEELQTAQQQLIHSEKQASLGQLAAGVAHEVNNPLGTILLYADILMKDPNLPRNLHADLDLISKEAHRCKTIVSGLLDFSRQREIFTRQGNINDLLRETIDLIKNQKARRDIEYILELDPDMPPMELDPEQIKQVIVNMVINGIEAMNEKGIITVRSKFKEKEDRVVFCIGDTGPGIPQENIKKLFTPFFTTKQIGKGTGLGLAICYGIIKMHRGDIRVATEVGKGSEFIVTLPRLHRSSGTVLGTPNAGTLAVGYQPRRFKSLNP